MYKDFFLCYHIQVDSEADPADTGLSSHEDEEIRSQSDTNLYTVPRIESAQLLTHAVMACLTVEIFTALAVQEGSDGRNM